MSGPVKLQEPINREVWYTFNLFGEPAYADSGLCLIGKAPSKQTQDLSQDRAGKLERAMVQRDSPMSVKSKNDKHVYFDRLDLPVDTRYYEHVLSEYPDATFHLPRNGKSTKPITIKSGGKIVGAMMCMDVR